MNGEFFIGESQLCISPRKLSNPISFFGEVPGAAKIFRWYRRPRCDRKICMNVADARTAVLAAINRMNSAYGDVLFDECVLVQVSKEQGTILAYDGPRADSYAKRFK